MSKLVIKAENISKQYRLGEVGTGTLSHDLNRFWFKVRGKEDPYLKIGESNDRAIKGGSDYVWSLRDINFEIEQGDAVGIIGRNGAGKSTLLKLLSKVTKPTTGNFKINGRIASLLEVGTGFNPEMTGRENIYLNGAILGMRRHEITRKLDEIIDFSGVERYIDTPVKRYSSGMYVRLAFAVAAHLESEILIVDEVLAVGDAEFQKKCLGKMGDVSKGEGRTVLFVSHNMGAVSNLCNKGIYLKNGLLIDQNTSGKIIDLYINEGNNNEAEVVKGQFKYQQECPHAYFEAIRILSEGEILNSVRMDKEVHIELEYTVLTEGETISPSIHLLDALGTCIVATFNSPSIALYKDDYYEKPLSKGTYKSVCVIPANFLNDTNYMISAFLVPSINTQMAIAREVLSFKAHEISDDYTEEYTASLLGQIRPKFAWKTEKI